MDFSKAQEGMRINYIGDSWAFGGSYTVVSAESTYLDKSKCPEHEKGKLMIIELMNNDTPMFFMLDKLNPSDWELEIKLITDPMPIFPIDEDTDLSGADTEQWYG